MGCFASRGAPPVHMYYFFGINSLKWTVEDEEYQQFFAQQTVTYTLSFFACQ